MRCSPWLACVRGGPVADREHHLVTVGPHRRHAAAHVVTPRRGAAPRPAPPCAGRRRRPRSPRGLVAGHDQRRAAGQRVVGRRPGPGASGRAGRARAAARAAPAAASLASHTSSVNAVASSSRPPVCLSRALRWRRTLSTLAAQRVVAGVQAHQRVVEEAPALRRPVLHDGQVVGREHRDPQRAEQVAGPAQRLAVDEHPVAPVRLDLRLDQQLAALALGQRPHDRERRPAAHERVGRRAPERRQRRQPGERLEQVGLALAVGADEGGETRRRGRAGRRRSCGSRSARGCGPARLRAPPVSSPAPA